MTTNPPTRSLVTLLTSLMLVQSGDALAAQEDATARSHRRGVQLLRDALTAHGGRDVLEAHPWVSIHSRVNPRMPGQGARVGTAYLPPGYSIRQALDLRTGTTAYHIGGADAQTARSTVWWSRDSVVVFQPGTNQLNDVSPSFARTSILLPAVYAPGLLLDAFDRSSTVRWIGSTELDGVSRSTLTYVDEADLQLSMTFDDDTHLLRAVSRLRTTGVLGDHSITFEFDDYRSVAGISVPHAIRSSVAGIVTSEAHFDSVRFDSVEPRRTAWPDDVERSSKVWGEYPTGTPTIVPLGSNVFAVLDIAFGYNHSFNYNTLFAEVDGEVIVFDAPGNSSVSEAMIELIEETLPGRTIGTVVTTHHHDDHIGGLWPYMKRGAVIVTTEGSRSLLEGIATAPRAAESDPDRENPPVVSIDVVEGEKTFGSGEPVVRIFEVGPLPHVEEMLIAYLPGPQLLFVADVYNPTFEGGPASRSGLVLADELERLNLPITRVLPAHGIPGSGDDFWAAVELARNDAENEPR